MNVAWIKGEEIAPVLRGYYDNCPAFQRGDVTVTPSRIIHRVVSRFPMHPGEDIEFTLRVYRAGDGDQLHLEKTIEGVGMNVLPYAVAIISRAGSRGAN